MRRNDWERLAPPAMLINILTAIRSYALIIIYFAYRTYVRFEDLSIFNSFDLFIDFLFNIIPAFLIILSGIMNYRKYRYRLGRDHFHVEQGWIRREKKSIPIDKIQSVQIEQNWLYQLLKVYLVKIDTIGEEGLEAEVGGVRQQEAIRLKQQIQIMKDQEEEILVASAEGDSSRAEEPQMEYFLDNQKIFRYSVTENILWFLLPFTLLIILILRIYHSADAESFSWKVLLNIMFREIQPGGDVTFEDQFDFSYLLLYGLVLATFSSGMVLFNKIFGLFNYRLSYSDQEIHIRRGLINKFETIIPRRKIQFTTWYTNLIRRKLGIYTLSYKYAGGKNTLGADAIVPFFDTTVLPALIRPYHVIEDKEPRPYYQISKVFLWRNFIFAKLPAAAAMIFLCYWIHPFLFYLSFLVPFYFYGHNYFYVRNFRIYLYRDYFLISRGVWGRRKTLVRWEKIQKVSIRQSPYQRRKDFVHLHLHTAAANLIFPYLHKPLAEDLLNYSLYKTESSKRFLF